MGAHLNNWSLIDPHMSKLLPKSFSPILPVVYGAEQKQPNGEENELLMDMAMDLIKHNKISEFDSFMETTGFNIMEHIRTEAVALNSSRNNFSHPFIFLEYLCGYTELRELLQCENGGREDFIVWLCKSISQGTIGGMRSTSNTIFALAFAARSGYPENMVLAVDNLPPISQKLRKQFVRMLYTKFTETEYTNAVVRKITKIFGVKQPKYPRTSRAVILKK